MPYTILVADDFPEIIDLIAATLDPHGYEVITASDGRQAWELIVDRMPDLVIMDDMMPFVDGFEVMQRMEKDPKTRCIPVVPMSALSQVQEVCKDWKPGFLSKPIDPAMLLEIVERNLPPE